MRLMERKMADEPLAATGIGSLHSGQGDSFERANHRAKMWLKCSTFPAINLRQHRDNEDSNWISNQNVRLSISWRLTNRPFNAISQGPSPVILSKTLYDSTWRRTTKCARRTVHRYLGFFGHRAENDRDKAKTAGKQETNQRQTDSGASQFQSTPIADLEQGMILIPAKGGKMRQTTRQSSNRPPLALGFIRQCR